MARMTKKDIADITQLALKRGLDPAAVLAIAHVESGGLTGSLVNGRVEPIIRFEGHYFDRRLTPAQRSKARKAGLASPKAGGIANPSRQKDRYALLEKASAINKRAALESVSWGIGQVMGAHWKHLGYPCVDALVETARKGVVGQVSLMLDFIAKNGLQTALTNKDWRTFARRYNGPGYAKNRYDEKIARAYKNYRNKVPAAAKPPMLMRGAKGEAVVTLQKNLIALGFLKAQERIYGLATERAVRAFQLTHDLHVDGIVGPNTSAKLYDERRALKIEPARKTGFIHWLKSVISVFLRA